jgi:hypothetical protein
MRIFLTPLMSILAASACPSRCGSGPLGLSAKNPFQHPVTQIRLGPTPFAQIGMPRSKFWTGQHRMNWKVEETPDFFAVNAMRSSHMDQHGLPWTRVTDGTYLILQKSHHRIPITFRHLPITKASNQ